MAVLLFESEKLSVGFSLLNNLITMQTPTRKTTNILHTVNDIFVKNLNIFTGHICQLTLNWTLCQLMTGTGGHMGGQLGTRLYRCEFQSVCISNLLCYKVCVIIQIDQGRWILGGKLLLHRNYC